METPGGGVKATGVCVILAALIVASSGTALAQKGEDHYLMGKKYLDGTGVKQDNAEAAKWFRKAAERGHADAEGELHKLGLTWNVRPPGENAPRSVSQSSVPPRTTG